MRSPVASGSSLHTIRIFLPGTQLENAAAGSRVKCGKGEESVTSKTAREQVKSSLTGKRKRERQSLESGGDRSHHRQYSAKKSKQNDNADVYTHLHLLQDYLQPGLDGTPFSQPCLRFQIELGPSLKWCSAESSGYITPATSTQACAERYHSPGRMSAETGHHFANPTNHFWRCLHRSGNSG
ncbi:hypothetical protein J3R83DRAFT_10216 [Lanmaoa asiatica]|nr:hypothetical protein J3R83DRAFT_10216 [Lanmaoa asiatica]